MITHKRPPNRSTSLFSPCGAFLGSMLANSSRTWVDVTCPSCLLNKPPENARRGAQIPPRTTVKGGKNRSGRIPPPKTTIHAGLPVACASESIHTWFELTYAQYLTVPRSALQSMPDEWQDKFVTLLNQLDDRIDWRPESGQYWVTLKDDRGRIRRDPLMDYDRGRRRLPLKEVA